MIPLCERRQRSRTAHALQEKMSQASSLIDGLSGERERWNKDKERFAESKRRLVGDCAVACAFLSYCGPFNQDYRSKMVDSKFIELARQCGIPVSDVVDPIEFLANVSEIGDWNLQGLPADPLSIQNGILVTKSSRYPLLVDPQGQAISWIVNKEKEEERMPPCGVVQLSDSKLKDHLEYAMSEGLSLIVAGVEEEIDPALDPLLQKEIVKRGRNLVIKLFDKT